MYNAKLQDDDIIEVQGFVMLKGLDEGRYRVRIISGPSGVPVYDFRRPGGRKVLARHYAASVDIAVKPSDDEDLNKIVVVSRGNPVAQDPSMDGGAKAHSLVGAQVDSVTRMLASDAGARHWSTQEHDRPAVLNLAKKAGRVKEAKDSVFKNRQKYESFQLFPAADPELNRAGTIFGVDGRSGKGFYVLGSSDDDFAMRGLVILDMRPMSREELEAQGWMLSSAYSIHPTALVMSDKSVLFPSMDPGGNGPGIWVVDSKSDEELI